MKKIIFIHGGESFGTEQEYQNFLRESYIPRQMAPWEDIEKPDWRKEILKNWIRQGWEGYFPSMPNKIHARYAEWKILFEALISQFESGDRLTFVGSSLGGCFLLKYFSEMRAFPFLIEQMHLVAACISEGDFTTPDNYEYLQQLENRLHIWHAEDDPIVPIHIGKEIASHFPDAQIQFFSPEKGYGHFYGIPRFAELETMLSTEKIDLSI